MTLETIQYHLEDMKERLSGTPDFAPGLIQEVKGQQVYIHNDNYLNTSAIIDMEKNTIVAASGSRYEDSRQDLNELLNGKLLRNAKYIIDGGAFKYYTDACGRTRKAVTILSDYIDIQHGQRPKYAVLGKAKQSSDDFSHIIGSSLMAPHEAINIVCLNWRLNREVMGPIESFLSAPIRAKAHYRLSLMVKLDYPTSSSRPISIHYQAELLSNVASGSFKFTFDNCIER